MQVPTRSEGPHLSALISDNMTSTFVATQACDSHYDKSVGAPGRNPPDRNSRRVPRPSAEVNPRARTHNQNENRGEKSQPSFGG